jgi:hypothetical protein
VGYSEVQESGDYGFYIMSDRITSDSSQAWQLGQDTILQLLTELTQASQTHWTLDKIEAKKERD